MPDTPASGPVVDLRQVHYSVGSRKIFDGVDIQVARGSITAVMGPSGTGKTTLLRLITGQSRADSGAVTVFDREVARLSRSELYALRRRMGMLFQNGALLTDIDVFENVAYPVREHCKLPETLLRRLVLMKLQAVGLRGAAHLQPSELSGGMARRVALARAIVMDPEILIYDEPFVGLDPISMGVVCRLIRELNDALGITSIVVSHDVQEVTSIADRSYLLAGGKVVAAGSSAELRDADVPAVRQFMEGAPDGPVPFHYPAPDYVQQLLDEDAS
ncbi:MAG: ABC transporter ATP-binding protein [Sphingomonadales bacterium]|nr:MAG: ABC transporter ATP-binding protein [Sphingomonadales bacterium]